MTGEICAYLHNYFQYDILFGTFSVVDGELYVKACANLPANTNVNDVLTEGQYIRIVGSALNDGVYQVPLFDLEGVEEFEGAIWLMALPRAFKQLVEDIQNWTKENESVINSPYTSESFGGYSYSKASSVTGIGGYDWTSQFASRLNKYRKVREI